MQWPVRRASPKHPPHRPLPKAGRMTDKPVPTYVVSVFEKPHWRTVLSTKDKEKAFALAKEIGDKVRIEEIAPKVKKGR